MDLLPALVPPASWEDEWEDMTHPPSSRDSKPLPLLAFLPGSIQASLFQNRWFVMGAALVLAVVIGIAFRFGRRIWNALDRRLAPAVLSSERIHDDDSFRSMVFLHHSTGENLIVQGRVREQLAGKGYAFWDHGYNWYGLTRPDGRRTRTHYGIPESRPGVDTGGNTDPEGLAVLFSQPVGNTPGNAFSRLLQHRVLIFKSCFPNSAIKDDAALGGRKALYLKMRDAVDEHPDRLFILLTTPPLHPKETTPSEAEHARVLARWLSSEAFLGGRPNLRVFDFFDLLADPGTHMLKGEYQLKGDSGDSHPNAKANESVGPLLVDFLEQAVQGFRPSSGTGQTGARQE